MLDMVLNVIREQSVFVLMGLLIAGGLFSQFMASRRYRKLRGAVQSLAALQTSSASPTSRTQAGSLARSERAQRRREAQIEQARQERKTEQESPSGQTSKSEPADKLSAADAFSLERTAGQVSEAELPVKAETQDKDSRSEGAVEGEVDSQLLYLRQSLDRIAAGRDQKLDEEPRRRRKLSPAEEQIIIDILKEYLS